MKASNVAAGIAAGHPATAEVGLEILAAGGSAQSVAEFMQTGLTGAGFSIEGTNGPAEDGSLVVDATGPDPKCKVQVRARPLSGTTNLVVLYGAGCPFN